MTIKSSKTEPSIERPPVIAIMGHIDHGKSKLLDYIRQTNIVDSESGGITQHTSAYEVIHKNKDGVDKKITFLDTPGHAAFETMRERGAVICDIAILIVSAEEGVKAQTIEALHSIQSAQKPFIVAFTKIDKSNADVEKAKQSLAEISILVEGYGGSIPWVAISSKTGEGVPELLDLMLLVAELEELKGETETPARGFVLEAGLDSK
ncbi:MAG: Translation initiation factor IF-2 protein, partial [Candidatus Nomurabacteria bacterium GW2011_GWA2_42_41]